jgi:uncharacterized membrane protein
MSTALCVDLTVPNGYNLVLISLFLFLFLGFLLLRTVWKKWAVRRVAGDARRG